MLPPPATTFLGFQPADKNGGPHSTSLHISFIAPHWPKFLWFTQGVACDEFLLLSQSQTGRRAPLAKVPGDQPLECSTFPLSSLQVTEPKASFTLGLAGGTHPPLELRSTYSYPLRFYCLISRAFPLIEILQGPIKESSSRSLTSCACSSPLFTAPGLRRASANVLPQDPFLQRGVLRLFCVALGCGYGSPHHT